MVDSRLPLPRASERTQKDDEAIRKIVESIAPRILYVNSYAGGMVTLQEADGEVIDEAIPWASTGDDFPQPGQPVMRMMSPGKGVRSAAGAALAVGLYTGADNGIYPYPNGTAYGDMIDSTAGINAAAVTARTERRVLRLTGTYRIDSTVALIGDFNLYGATFICDDDDLTAVRVGITTNGANRTDLYGLLPHIINNAQVVGSGWSGHTSVGVEIANLMTSHIKFGRVAGFAEGVKVTAYGAGCAFNVFTFGWLDNNERNLFVGQDDTSAYVTQNLFMGGRFSHRSAEGTNVSGVRQILIQHPSGGVHCDSNIFLGISLEGDVPEYHVRCFGRANHWIACRWEANPPKIYWRQNSSSDYARDNRVWRGIRSDEIIVTADANVRRNKVDDEKDILFGGVNYMYTPVLTATPNAVTGSHASTSTFQTTITETFDLPEGEWELKALASSLFSHSTAGSMDCQLTIDGTAGTVLTQQVTSTAPGTRIYRQGTKSNVDGPASITVTFAYRSNTAGTTAADNPSLTVTAKRTGA